MSDDNLCAADQLGLPFCDSLAIYIERVWCGPLTSDEMDVGLCSECRDVFQGSTKGRAA